MENLLINIIFFILFVDCTCKPSSSLNDIGSSDFRDRNIQNKEHKPIRHRHGLKGLRSAPQDNDGIKIKSYTHHISERLQYENKDWRQNDHENWRQNGNEAWRQNENEAWQNENKQLITHKSENQDWRQNDNEVIKLDDTRDDISLTSDNKSLDPDTLKGKQSLKSYQKENTGGITDRSPRHLGHMNPRKKQNKRSHYNDDSLVNSQDNIENPPIKTDTESNPLDRDVSHIQGHGKSHRQRSRSSYNDGDIMDKVDNKDIAVSDVIDIRRQERLYKHPLESSNIPESITETVRNQERYEHSLVSSNMPESVTEITHNAPLRVTSSVERQLNDTSIPMRFFKIPKSERELRALVKEASDLDICLRRHVSYRKGNLPEGVASIDNNSSPAGKITQTRLIARLCRRHRRHDKNEGSPRSNVIRREQTSGNPLTSNSIAKPSSSNPTSEDVPDSNQKGLHSNKQEVHSNQVFVHSNATKSANVVSNKVELSDKQSKQSMITHDEHATKPKSKNIILQVCSGQTSILTLTKRVISKLYHDLHKIAPHCHKAGALAKLIGPFKSSTGLSQDAPLPISNKMLSDMCSLSHELDHSNCYRIDKNPDIPVDKDQNVPVSINKPHISVAKDNKVPVAKDNPEVNVAKGPDYPVAINNSEVPVAKDYNNPVAMDDTPEVTHTSQISLDPPPKTDHIIPTTTNYQRPPMIDTYPFFREGRARLEWEDDILFY